MQDRSRQSTRMLIDRNRIYYWGLAGRSMKLRRLGALAIYAVPDGHFELSRGNGPFIRHRIAAVAPYEPHRIKSGCGWVSTICVEPESVSEAEITRLLAEANSAGTDSDEFLKRLQASRRSLIEINTAETFSSAEFDKHLFGRKLEARQMDTRIQRALDLMANDLLDQVLSAEDCAQEVGLSASRFLHLYKEKTNYSFRAQRMWKRARRFMDHASTENSLTCVAMDLGYSDSSHFSHSVRGTFGLQPRAIRHGSRGMRVSFGADYAAAGTMAI